MSSTSSIQFMAYCPDKTDEGAPARRAEVRERHLANAKELENKGVISESNSVRLRFMTSEHVGEEFGGALVSPDTLDKQLTDQKMVGSMIIVEAESLQKCMDLIKSDIYYTTRVVRLFFPFLIAVLMFGNCGFASSERQWDSEKLVVLPFRGKPL